MDLTASFNILFEDIRSYSRSPTCPASYGAKNEALCLILVVSLMFEEDSFTSERYDAYISHIYDWIAKYGDRLYIMNRSGVDEIRTSNRSMNSVLTDKIFKLIPIVDQIATTIFGFVPPKSSLQKSFESTPSKKRHGKFKSRPIPITAGRGAGTTFHFTVERPAPDFGARLRFSSVV